MLRLGEVGFLSPLLSSSTHKFFVLLAGHSGPPLDVITEENQSPPSGKLPSSPKLASMGATSCHGSHHSPLQGQFLRHSAATILLQPLPVLPPICSGWILNSVTAFRPSHKDRLVFISQVWPGAGIPWHAHHTSRSQSGSLGPTACAADWAPLPQGAASNAGPGPAETGTLWCAPYWLGKVPPMVHVLVQLGGGGWAVCSTGPGPARPCAMCGLYPGPCMQGWSNVHSVHHVGQLQTQTQHWWANDWALWTGLIYPL